MILISFVLSAVVAMLRAAKPQKKHKKMNRIIKQSFSTAVKKNVVIVDGVRIPFTLAGTAYKDLLAVDLGRLAIKGLVDKTGIDTKQIDYIYYGTVIQETRTSNIAREAALGAGLPHTIPGHTVTQACISANQAITSAAEKIITGQADIVIAGGCETFSDVPIRLSKPLRQALLSAQKLQKKGPFAALGAFSKVKLSDFIPEAPAIANYTTGEVMGHSSDRLSAKFGITRNEQDEFTVRSHVLAAKAHADGLYSDEVIPVNGSVIENGIKGDTTLEKVSKLSPAFIKGYGTHTAANSSFLTDGASATLIMSEDKALELGYQPKAYLRGWTYVASDPFEELLLGPTYAIKQLLTAHSLRLSDIGVVELHEAFAGQVLSNLTAMASTKFAEEKFSDRTPVGSIDLTRMNTLGGSLSLGHPFGATGGRLITTASNRLQREQQRFALLAACADGGLAHAALLERYNY